MSPIYVAYYTLGTPYEAEALELAETLAAFGLDSDLQGVPNRGTWLRNTSYKPTFLRDMLLEYEGRPVVYLDADARVRQRPELFDTLDCDFAAHWKDGHELLSGTLYFGPTPEAWRLVREWESECQSHPDVWDQKCLDIAAARFPDLCKVHLPAAYCQIFDLMSHHGRPCIEHMQASRRFKKAVER
jgi:hypothetical protein